MRCSILGSTSPISSKTRSRSPSLGSSAAPCAAPSWEAPLRFPQRLGLDLHHSVHQRLHALLHLGKHLSDFLKDSVHAWQVELEAWRAFESWVAFVKDLNIFVDFWLLHLGEDLFHGGHLLHPWCSLIHPGDDILHPGEELGKAEPDDGGTARVLLGHHVGLRGRGGHDWSHPLWSDVEALGPEHDRSWSSEDVQEAGDVSSWNGGLRHPGNCLWLRLDAGPWCLLPCLGRRRLWPKHCRPWGTLCPYKRWATSPGEGGGWGRGTPGEYGSRGRGPLSGQLLHVALSGDIAVKVESAARLTSWQEGSLKSLVATLVAALQVSKVCRGPRSLH